MLKKTKILHRIALSALLPLLTLAALATYEISAKWLVRTEMARLRPVAESVGKLSRFVHELQRERGMSSAFLSSKGVQMGVELARQRQQTDAERASAVAALGELRHAEGMGATVQACEEQLGQLDRYRGEIDARSVTPPVAVGYLTEIVGRLIGLINGMSILSDDDEISKAIIAYANLTEGKERAGLERATLTSCPAVVPALSRDPYAQNVVWRRTTFRMPHDRSRGMGPGVLGAQLRA